MISLLIADDHPLIRRALEQLLGSHDDIDVVGIAANGREAVEQALACAPDVVLMDLEMPELDGLAAIVALQAAGSRSNVVVLTTFSDRERILSALDAGALGYLLKDAEPDEIIRGVRAAALGDSPIAPRAAREVITRPLPEPEPPPVPMPVPVPLSARESEVLSLVA